MILGPKEAVAAMKKVKRPVTEEKKNIAATHAVMDKVNLIGDKFQVRFSLLLEIMSRSKGQIIQIFCFPVWTHQDLLPCRNPRSDGRDP